MPRRSVSVVAFALVLAALALPSEALVPTPTLPGAAGLARAEPIFARVDAGGDPLASAIDLVLLARGPSASAPSRHADLEAAIATLAGRSGIGLDADASREIAAIDPALALALRDVVDAFLAFDDEARLAFEPTRGFDARAMGKLDALVAARAALLHATIALRDAHAHAPPSTVALQLCPAIELDLVGAASLHAAPCILSIDVGGDDVYTNNAGGNGLDGCVTLPAAAAAIDLAGNDRYGDAAAPRACGQNGGGYFGAGLLIDAAGDDRYFADGWGANGGAAVGAGLLVDAGGDDTYRAGLTRPSMDFPFGGLSRPSSGSHGVNGGAYQGGLGGLVDLSGRDVYRAGLDVATVTADDTVWIGSFGVNGGAAGTIPFVATAGFLIDGSGDDLYHAGHVGDSLVTRSATTVGAIGVNGGGYLGAGLLLDGGGADRYRASLDAREVGQWYSNGGWHVVASHGVNGGGALGTGLLVDRDGDDAYEAIYAAARSTTQSRFVFGSDGVNGGSGSLRGNDLPYDAGGAGALLDLDGDDRYVERLAVVDVAAGSTILGLFGVNGGGSGGPALLLDAAGTDTYEEGGLTCADCSATPKELSGARLDL